MLKSFRNSVLSTATTIMPLLLTACGDDPDPPSKTSLLALLMLPLLFFTVSLASEQIRQRARLIARRTA
jgi:hypothetical protein